MKPIIILPPDTMSKEDLEQLRANNLCVVVCTEPSNVKFMDPIPSMADRSKIECAAISLSRKILNPGFWTSNDTRRLMAETYVDLLVNGTPLSAKPTKEEVEKEAFDNAKMDELRRLAREEAKAERLAASKKKP